MTILGGRASAPTVALALFAVRSRPTGGGISLAMSGQARNGRSRVAVKVRRRNSELFVDDLRTWRGVVLGRAVSTLRSVETQPSAWGFVPSSGRGPVFGVAARSAAAVVAVADAAGNGLLLAKVGNVCIVYIHTGGAYVGTLFFILKSTRTASRCCPCWT